jgi:trimeric autotransporter adhesin
MVKRFAASCVFVLVCRLASACTPLADGSVLPDAGRRDGDDAMAAHESEPSAAAVLEQMTSTAEAGDTCDAASDRTCARERLGVSLRCQDGGWIEDAVCREGERCETRVGPEHGTCVPIDPPCLGRSSETEVCDGDELRICIDGVLAPTRGCGRQQRCAAVEGEVNCVCMKGFVDDGAGCQPATSCASGNGGCDTLVECSLGADEPVCGACPNGYSGNGSDGCVPNLLGLTVSGGELAPAFGSSSHEYRVRVPLLVDKAEITATVPEGSTLEFDGERAPSGAAWTTSHLDVGAEQTVQLALSTEFASNNRYALTLERSNVQEAYVKASNPDADDNFGYSLAVSGNTMVVGAPNEDSAVPGEPTSNAAIDSGAAYVFVRRDGQWMQQDYLKAAQPEDNAFFGISVAISGDTIAVGCPRSDLWGTTSARTGGVYVFTRQGGRWSEQTRLAVPDSAAQDGFGMAIALQGDRLVVGAPYESSGAQLSGALYVFERSGTDWSDGTKLKAMQPSVDAMLGFSVALDGDTLVSGAVEDSQLDPSRGGPGFAIVFERDGTRYVEREQLRAPQPIDAATFGFSVALLGDTLAIGAPRAALVRDTPPGEVHVFERQGGRWSSTATVKGHLPVRSNGFGGSIALAGSLLLVGSTLDTTVVREDGMVVDSNLMTGSAFVFERRGAEWPQVAFMKASNASPQANFGAKVAAADETIAVSSYTENGGSPGIDGDQASTSRRASGALYVFE